MNLPNKLTVFRMVLVPFFVAAVLWGGSARHYLYAALLFAAAAYTDRLDGKLARRNNQVTDFGKFMDPLADKVLVISALVCFVQLGLTNIWFVLLIIAREFMVTSVRLVAADSGVVIAANRWGKAKTVSQITAVLAVLLFQYWEGLISAGTLAPFSLFGISSGGVLLWAGQAFMLVATVFTVISGIIYLKQNWNLIKTAK